MDSPSERIKYASPPLTAHPIPPKVSSGQRSATPSPPGFNSNDQELPLPTSSANRKDTTTPNPHFCAPRASPSQRQNRQDVYPRKLPLHRRPPHQRHRSPLRRPLPRAHQPLPLFLRPDLWLEQRRKRKGKDYQPDRQRTDTDENTLDRNQHHHHSVRTHPRIRCYIGVQEMR